MYPRFVIRKIRNGRAKIFGKWYYPDTQWLQYDGRLDGMNYAFGLYLDSEGNLENFVNLWGTKEQYHNFGKTLDDPQILEDGSLPWLMWGTEEWVKKRHG